MFEILKRLFSKKGKLASLNYSVITRKARKEMIEVHSQKYIEAWLNEKQYREKLAELQADWELVSPEAKERVEAFIDRRLKNPEGAMLPEAEIAHAVNVRMAIDTAAQNHKNSISAFKFYEEIIKSVQQI